MKKNEALIVVLVLMLGLNFIIPMLLSEFSYSFELPLIGEIASFNLVDYFTSYGFIIGSVLTVFLVYIFVERRNVR